VKVMGWKWWRRDGERKVSFIKMDIPAGDNFLSKKVI